MKTLSALTLIALLTTGCFTAKNASDGSYQAFTYKIAVIDSTNEVENANSPGTFLKVYDTLDLFITNGPEMKAPVYKVVRRH